MASTPLDSLPGFRRSFLVTPASDQVTAAVEDDYHCMAVTLHHDGTVVTEVEPVMERAPWTTCPGAPAVLQATFTGTRLSAVSPRTAKQANCTHLHDLAVLAAAHAGDRDATRFDILASDAVDEVVTAEIRRDGVPLVRIAHRDDVIVEPAEIAGTSLFKIRDWINALDEPYREAARLLQWGTIIAHGRAIPLERQSDASRMPPNCYTFQPGNKERAVRVGRIVDFTAKTVEPLDHFDGERFAARVPA